ncbi:MAG: caspase family protein [Polyangia bacterium]
MCSGRLRQGGAVLLWLWLILLARPGAAFAQAPAPPSPSLAPLTQAVSPAPPSPPSPPAALSPLEIVSPRDGDAFSQPRLTLRARVPGVKDPASLRIRVLVDGAAADTGGTRGIKLARPDSEPEPRGTLAVSVELPPRDCTLTVLAEADGAALPPQRLALRFRGPLDAPSAPRPPDLYILAIGVAAYRDPRLQLLFPGKDARDLVALFKRQEGALYRSVHVRLLVDEQATRAALLDGLAWLKRSATARDVSLVFLAGHGFNEPDTGAYVFFPYDVAPEISYDTAVAGTELRAAIAELPGKVLLFLDSCHSGNVLETFNLRGQSGMTELVRELLSVERSIILFAASTGKQPSRESAAWGNGAFTKALLEGLGGQADELRTGRVTVNMLDLYISERVRALTHGAQTPSTAKPGMTADFPLAAVLPRADSAERSGSSGRALEQLPRHLLLAVSVGVPVAGIDRPLARRVPELALSAAVPIRARVLALLPSLELRYESWRRTDEGSVPAGVDEALQVLSLRAGLAVRLLSARVPLEVTLDPLGLRAEYVLARSAAGRFAWEPAAALALRIGRWRTDTPSPRALWIFLGANWVVGGPVRLPAVDAGATEPATAPIELGAPWFYARAGVQAGF